MIQLLSRLESIFPFLHRRAATEDDFFGYTAGRVEIVFTPDIATGVYVVYAGSPYIFLNNKLHGWFLRYVMFHELAHHLFHYPSQSSYGVEFFSVHSKQKNHCEAETVAALLLMPLHDLPPSIEFADERFAGLIRHRLEIFNTYRI